MFYHSWNTAHNMSEAARTLASYKQNYSIIQTASYLDTISSFHQNREKKRKKSKPSVLTFLKTKEESICIKICICNCRVGIVFFVGGNTKIVFNCWKILKYSSIRGTTWCWNFTGKSCVCKHTKKNSRIHILT